MESYRQLLPDGGYVARLHAGQTRVHNSKARFVVVQAGTQGGKTCYGPDWLIREIEGDKNYPGRGSGDYLVVTATFPLLELKLLPEFRKLFEYYLKRGEFSETKKIFTYYKDKDDIDKRIRIIFGSATNPENIESATAKAAWLDEAGQKQFRRETWEAIQRRLSLHQGRCLFTTTLYGLGWFKAELYDRAKAGDKNIEIIQFRSTENPAFPVEEYERARHVLPSWKFKMFYQGEYDKPAGVVYDSFNEALCKIRRFNVPKDWPRYVGVDFGNVNTAAVWYALNPSSGDVYAYREYLALGSVANHVDAFRRLSQDEWIVKTIGGSHQEEGWREAFNLAGWPVAESNIQGPDSVEVGISRVYALHKQNKLYVFDDLHKYLDEKLSYNRKLDDNYQPTEEIEDKASYHLMDAERYILSDFAQIPNIKRGQREKIPVMQF